MMCSQRRGNSANDGVGSSQRVMNRTNVEEQLQGFTVCVPSDGCDDDEDTFISEEVKQFR